MVAVLTHGVPHVDVAAAPPVVALGEGPPVGEHVAPLRVETLPEAVVVHPGRPVVDVARVELSVSWTQTERTEVCVSVTVFRKMKEGVSKIWTLYSWHPQVLPVNVVKLIRLKPKLTTTL